MPSVSYEKEMPLGVKPLYETLVRVLDQVVAQSQANNVAMCIGGAPAPGELCVPVTVVVTRRSAEDASIGVAIDARTDDILFPRFKGAFLALPLSADKATLRLTGEYRVPIGAIGSIVNAAAGRG